MAKLTRAERPCRKCGGPRSPMGGQYRCRPCHAAWGRQRKTKLTPEQREAERVRGNELRNIARAAWTPEKREAAYAASRAWREANPGRVKALSRAWYEANAEYARAAKLAEYYANPEQFYARNLVRKARIRDQVCEHGPKCVSAKFLRSTYSKDCVYCGQPAEHADHFYPLARGGLHCVKNIVPACAPCNSDKKARDPGEFLISKGIIPG